MGRKISVYLTNDDIARLDALMRHYKRQEPWRRINRSQVIRLGIYTLFKQADIPSVGGLPVHSKEDGNAERTDAEII